MAQINKSSEYFNTKLYTGNGSSQSITGVGFQPDWLWIKRRNNANNHQVFDVIRGTNVLVPNETGAESDYSSLFTSLDSDGFTFPASSPNLNASGGTYASWNWLAGGTASSNTDGSITSNISANTTSGFSIVSYSGNSTSNASVGHGLGATPKIVLVKSRSNAEGWVYWQDTTGNGTADQRLDLNGTNANRNNHFMTFQNTTFTFPTLADNSWNLTGYTYIAYCFAEKKGFSKFGSYTGNGSTDGTFVYTGFKPAWFMTKRTDSTGDWRIRDIKREPGQPLDAPLSANLSNAENDGDNDWDVLSNGLKLRGSGTGENASGGSYIYMAFAENPLVGTNNIPATAR